ncbi:sensor histidine kinase [Sphingomonas quercus]|uniref:Histidine kinase n=1 Tax=Sphingomonas quercus TaxID=2842451 RepID=A0ABS6BIQ9_9SPHN|nr:histidine kinase [Sphingomonas quercus]MBU3078203.1 histidine kinase [Sphingomonas quercus]
MDIRDRSGRRQSAWLTIGLWCFTYLTFLMPSFADRAVLAWYDYPIIAAAVAPGVLLSVPVYLLLWSMRRRHFVPRMMAAGVAAVLAAWLHSMLDVSITMLLRGMFVADAPVTVERLMTRFLTYVWIYELYATAIGLILSAATSQVRERQLVAARIARHQAELAALRFQINPHFLFNTLNAISSLIVTGKPGKADEMLGRLSGFLRASLAGGPSDTVVLADELDTLSAYLDIEGVRFGERLRFDLECPPELEDALVPGFILQPLVENAVKYAVGPSRRGATIRLAVSAEEGQLAMQVSDDGADLTSDRPHGTGTGLENIRNRLDILYGRAAELEAGPTGKGYAATIRLPLHRDGDLRHPI